MSDQMVDELMTRHVLLDGEHVVTSTHEDDAVALTTDKRRQLSVRSAKADWMIGQAEWVDDFVVATRTDIHVHGQPERFAFVLPRDGAENDEIFVNDVAAIAGLGRRLHVDLEPRAYAELLVQFHPYTSALRTLLFQQDDLRSLFGMPSLPDVAPFEIVRDDDTIRLTFSSCVRYRRPGGLPQLDVVEWNVVAPADGPATWQAEIVDEGVPLVA